MRIASLIKVARLPFLIAGLVLFALGALVGALAGGTLVSGALLLGYFSVAAASLSVHFSNDYFDAETDTPGASTLISGGGDVLHAHPELRQTVRRIALLLIALSCASAVALVLIYSLPAWTLALVLLANLLGWYYSAPPLRLCERGWGEPAYAFAAGFLEPGMGYLCAMHTLDAGGAFLLAPLLAYGLVSILNVEIPDLESDRLARKHTWIEQRGRPFGFAASALLLLAAALYFFVAARIVARLPFDVRIVAWLSLLPLVPGLLGLFLRPVQRRHATLLATATVGALVLLGLLLDAYLFALVAR